MPKPGGTAMVEERFGDTVRFPRGDTTVVGEHVRVRCWRPGEGPVKLGEHRERRRIDVDSVSTFGLGRRQHGIVGSFDPTTAKRDPGSVDVDVASAQTEKLRSPRPGDSRGEEEHMQEQVAVSDEVQQ